MNMKKSFCIVWILLICGMSIFAANKEVSVRIYLNKDSVVVGEMFKLSVEASGVQSLDYAEPLDFGPNITQIRSEQSMSSSWINGVSSVSYTIAYYLRATEQGNYTIGPFKIKIRRDIYETNSVEIKVDEAGSSPSMPQSQGGGQQSAQGGARYGARMMNNARLVSDIGRIDRGDHHGSVGGNTSDDFIHKLILSE